MRERRDRLSNKLPHLANRIFSLKGKYYNGCGFHWHLVTTVGGLIHRVNNFDKKYTETDLMTDEVIFETLEKSVDEAELSHESVANLGPRE